MVGFERFWGICVIHGLSDRCAGPVTRVETNIVHSMADAIDRQEGFVGPRQAEVSTTWVIAPLGDHDDYEYQVSE